uniref:Uncharacterized protein n=1 Tax=Megaselia scalaris TaxID=36166 RepID=T1GVA0_MEGSC
MMLMIEKIAYQFSSYRVLEPGKKPKKSRILQVAISRLSESASSCQFASSSKRIFGDSLFKAVVLNLP